MADDVTLTLVFELRALRRTGDPEAVVEDARRWSEHVGIVSPKPPHVLSKFTRDHYIQQDLEPDPAPVEEILAHTREHFDTGRYVFVGTTEGHRETASAVDWEYLDVTEAAESAGWTLTEPESSPDSTRTETSTDDWP